MFALVCCLFEQQTVCCYASLQVVKLTNHAQNFTFTQRIYHIPRADHCVTERLDNPRFKGNHELKT
jgi:hypothetical protein